MRERLEHQEAAYLYCQGNPHAAIFMEMRLGKTKVVIDWLRGKPGPHLIIVPSPAVRVWEDELRLEDEDSILKITGTTSDKVKLLKNLKKWNITNYESVRMIDFRKFYWQSCIVDESPRIKNPRADITKICIDTFSNTSYKAILSGRPAPENDLNYVTQFIFLDGEFLGCKTFWEFRIKYCSVIPHINKWVIKPWALKKMKEFICKRSFILFRKDVNLANKKVYEKRYIPMEPSQKKLMKQLEREFVVDFPDGDKISTMHVPVKINWMAQLANGILRGKMLANRKYNELKDIISGELSGEPVVVWFHFNQDMPVAQKTLSLAGIKSKIINGETDEKTRWEYIKGFQEGKFSVLLIQQKIGRYALNLSNSSTAIYFSNGYSADDRQQSEDRIEHHTKKEPLLYIDLITEDTVDETIYNVLRLKEKNSREFMVEHLHRDIKNRHDTDYRSRYGINGMGSLV